MFAKSLGGECDLPVMSALSDQQPLRFKVFVTALVAKKLCFLIVVK